MRYSRLLTGFCLSIAIIAGCTKTSGSTASELRLGSAQPPQMMRSSMPDLPGEKVDVQISVMVDQYGAADMKTFKITGVASGRARDALRSWFAASRFTPGRSEDGTPVPAVYNTSVKTRIGRGR